MRRFIFILLCLVAAVSVPLIALAEVVDQGSQAAAESKPLETTTMSEERTTSQLDRYQGRLMSLDVRADRAIEQATGTVPVEFQEKLNDALVRVETARKVAHAELSALQKATAPQSTEQHIDFDRKVRIYEAAVNNAETVLRAH